MFVTVDFHPLFLKGTCNSDSHVDYPRMTPEERDRLDDFIDGVLEQQELDGRNKESFTDNDGTLIEAEEYQLHGLWHYHAGPYRSVGTHKTLPSLPTNLRGSGSKPVVHYIKDPGKDRIIVTGFSRAHNPFPKSGDTRNPLSFRLPTARKLATGIAAALKVVK